MTTDQKADKTESGGNEVNPPTHIIGIGASAGGLEALQSLFHNMPSDSGAAFVVVQHLSPDFKSVMAELLSKGTAMPVYNIADGVVVEANTIYLIPPRKIMMIAEGKLLLTEQMPEQGVNMPIDIFFRSLAEDQHHKAVGIVLSGTGSDGSRGIQAIKEVGGLVVVQDPDSAKFDGMPHSAVNTGLADMVLTPEEMPTKLISYIQHPVISGKDQSIREHIETNDEALGEIFRLLQGSSEIDFSQYKPSTVTRRIERRMGVNQLTKLREYHDLLLKDPRELQILSKDMLIGVTRFFRDSEPFTLLEKKIIPELFDTVASDETLRVWVAGCSSGEEAYSIAILLDEAKRKRKDNRLIKIFATDVDPDAIAEASSGIFQENIKDDLSPERLNTYFNVNNNNSFIISPRIRQSVIFAVHNLIKDPPFSNVHLVTCRNTLIYFQQAAQRRVMNSLHFSLVRGGVMMLGASESLGELAPHFETINERARLFRKNSNLRNLMVRNMPTRAEYRAGTTASNSNSLVRHPRAEDRSIAFRFVMDTLLHDYVPPSIILNDQFDIVHVYGDVSEFTRKIQPGRFSSNIKDMIHDDLSVALSTALHRASKNAADVEYKDVVFQHSLVNMRVRYLREKNLNSIYFLVVFDKRKQSDDDSTNADAIAFNHSDQSQQRINDLEQELQKNQENLQVTIEELETTNEELQSSNEELMAANEELQSTNEELQSVNEELYTVNSEYQEKITELTQVNNDIDNLLKSNGIGIIFLDEALLIRTFTPAITKYINVMDTDIGRPFHHLSNQLNYSGLLDDIVRVVEKEESIQKEIQTNNGDYVLARVMPYYNDRQQTQGTVLSLTNVTRYHNVEKALLEARRQLGLMSSTDEGQTAPDAIYWVGFKDRKAQDLLGPSLEQHTISVDDLPSKNEHGAVFLHASLGKASMEKILSKASQEEHSPLIIIVDDKEDGTVDDKKWLGLGCDSVLPESELSRALLMRTMEFGLRRRKANHYLQQIESATREMASKTL